MTTLQNRKIIVAFDLHPRRFAFAVFKGPNELLDFGARSFPRGPNAVRVPTQAKLAAIFENFDPVAVILSDRRFRRGGRKSRIAHALQKQALERGLPLRFVTTAAVKKAFAGHDSNKHEIASALARQFPALAAKLPPKRKIWQTECYRMSMFHAAALGVAYFARGKKAKGEFSSDGPDDATAQHIVSIP